MSEFFRKCPSCGVELKYTRSQDSRRAEMRGSRCIVCAKGTYDTQQCVSKKYNVPFRLGGSFIYDIKRKAVERGLTFNVSIEYLLLLIEQQNFKCALSGVEINIKSYTDKTASLDRIKNNLGYEEGNLQWVHKDVNILRGKLEVQKFIEICKAVANNNQ